MRTTKQATRIWGQHMSSLTLDMLHRVYDGPSAAKHMAVDARVSHRTAEKWWAGLTTPRVDVFLRIAQSNDRMRAELLRRLGDHGYGTGNEGGGRVVAPMAGDVAGQAGGLDRSSATVDRRTAERRRI